MPCARFVGSETTHWAYVLRPVQTRHRHSRMIFCFMLELIVLLRIFTRRPVSYTHLDVYKRQEKDCVYNAYKTSQNPYAPHAMKN